jgi:uncharacterized membrane-anchored protein
LKAKWLPEKAMNDIRQPPLSAAPAKVAAVTVGFWIAKIAATTLGETGGDWVTMSLDLGYLVGTGIFAAIFAVLVWLQVRASAFHPALYWATIVATTTLGTTMADFFDRSVGLMYPGGTAVITTLLGVSLLLWHRVEGTVSIRSIKTPRAEWFYWVTILFSQTLGTALGDWTADDDRGGLALGYEHAAFIFGGALVLVAALYFRTRLSRTALFWAAFVLTRPLGATLGDFLDKPRAQGGLELSRLPASLALLVFLVLCVALFPRRAARSDDAA